MSSQNLQKKAPKHHSNAALLRKIEGGKSRKKKSQMNHVTLAVTIFFMSLGLCILMTKVFYPQPDEDHRKLAYPTKWTYKFSLDPKS